LDFHFGFEPFCLLFQVFTQIANLSECVEILDVSKVREVQDAVPNFFGKLDVLAQLLVVLLFRKCVQDCVPDGEGGFDLLLVDSVDFDFRVDIGSRLVLGAQLGLRERVAQNQQVFLRQIAFEAPDARELLVTHAIRNVIE